MQECKQDVVGREIGHSSGAWGGPGWQEAQQAREEATLARMKAEEAESRRKHLEATKEATEGILRDARSHIEWVESRINDLESQVASPGEGAAIALGNSCGRAPCTCDGGLRGGGAQGVMTRKESM